MKNLIIFMILCTTSIANAATVWVEREGYHTALVLSAEDIVTHAPMMQDITGTRGYIRLGWGDRDYYGAERKTMGLMAKALFLPTPSVVEVANFKKPEQAGKTLVPLRISDGELKKLLAFITASIALDRQGQPSLVRKEPSGFRYYSAHGRYHLLRNCNNWTAKALHQSGQDVHYRTAFLAGRVMRQLD